MSLPPSCQVPEIAGDSGGRGTGDSLRQERRGKRRAMQAGAAAVSAASRRVHYPRQRPNFATWPAGREGHRLVLNLLLRAERGK